MNIELGFDGDFPSKYTCDGEDVSPPVSFSNLPEKAETVALIVDDPDAVEPAGKVWDHWLVWNIPVEESLPENFPNKEVVDSVVQGATDFDHTGYGGPCPPDGRHTYRFRAYALNTELDLSPKAGKEELLAAMKGHIVDKAQVKRDYER